MSTTEAARQGEWIVRTDLPRSFEPLGNEMVAGVYVHLPQGPGAGADELARHAGTTTTWPPVASITSSPAVKVALPSYTTKTSS